MLFLIYVGSVHPMPDLKDLQVSDWYRLGLALNLGYYDLERIDQDFQENRRGKRLKMFDLWLKTQPDPSYEQLIQALHEIGDETVANSLYEKYGKYTASDHALFY